MARRVKEKLKMDDEIYPDLDRLEGELDCQYK